MKNHWKGVNIFVLLLISTGLFGQNAHNFLRKGDKGYKQGDFEKRRIITGKH